MTGTFQGPGHAILGFPIVDETGSMMMKEIDSLTAIASAPPVKSLRIIDIGLYDLVHVHFERRMSPGKALRLAQALAAIVAGED